MSNINWKNRLINIAFLVGLFIFSFAMYIIFKPLLNNIRPGISAQCLGWAIIVICVIVGVVLKIYKKLSFNTLIALLFICAFAVKLTYVLNTPVFCRQHDTVTDQLDGHEAYAWILYTTKALPTTNEYQFYHPPLNAFIQSVFMHITKPFLEGYNAIKGSMVYNTEDMHVLFESNQILSLLYMNLSCYFGIKIVNRFNFSNIAKFFGIVFIIFFPRLIQLSGQLNNDSICALFMVLSMYFTIIWYQKPSWWSIMAIAVSEGLAMMSKFSGCTVCLATAVVFIIKLVQVIRAKNAREITMLLVQYACFVVVCGGLGLWFQIYSMKRFNQPFAFVFSNLNQALSTADHNFFERFINVFDFKQLTGSLFCRPFDDYNIFVYCIKSSIFGEFSYWQGEAFGLIAVVMNYLFTLLFTGLLVYFLIKTGKERLDLKIIAGVTIVGQILSMIYFNIKMPYGCTMDFRYIIPLIFANAMFLPYMHEHAVKEGSKPVETALVFSLEIIAGVFLISSNLFYLMAV